MDEELKKALYVIAKLLKEINEKIDKLGGDGEVFIDEKTEKILKEYERRDLANYIMKRGLPARLPDECPKCYEKGKIVKGMVIETIEFKNSTAYKYKCPVCGYTWVAQIKKKNK